MKLTTLSFDTGSATVQWEGEGLGDVEYHLLLEIKKQGQTAAAERGREVRRRGADVLSEGGPAVG